MSCRELERLFVSGADEGDLAAHRKTCGICAREGFDLDAAQSLTDGLVAPPFRPALRQALLAIPQQTVSCEGAETLLAAAVEDELAGADRARLDSHLSRCGACTSAANVLLNIRELDAPAPPAWLATRLVAARPAKPASRWRWLLSGRAVVAYAYAAALLVMILGLNPSTVVKGGGFAKLGVSTRNAVTVAQSSLTDRLGAVQERAVRTLAVWRGRVGGYGRAAVSNAIAIVSRPESKKSPSRPRLGKDGGNAGAPEGFATARRGAREPFPPRFRV